ncbi:xaa-Pro aminopeptidase 1-like isoform X2 [Palaemon carinicauda]|uniref:xaa-Pro aminopeptidase 1-like isoform X2 n=1 Tax=Palaemon carinicauda TaxID=392227 RepID=UPI0035B5DBBC
MSFSTDDGLLLTKLRTLMKHSDYVPQSLNAYIVPGGDAHQNEYVAECDKRLPFISGFSRSIGTAVITDTTAALWVESAYFMQAKEESDASWKVMCQGNVNTPSVARYLCKVLKGPSVVGADPYLVNAGCWQDLEREFHRYGHVLIPVSTNLIDLLWEDRPRRTANAIFPLEIKYTGRSVTEKVVELRDKLEEENTNMIIITDLDEIAYLFNLRGSDIACNPVFFSYAVVTDTEVFLFVNKSQLTRAAKTDLMLESVNIKILSYKMISSFIRNKLSRFSGNVWLSTRSSHAIIRLVPKDRRLIKTSPIAKMKSVKNKTEINGMEESNLRDSSALCQYLCWLEGEAKNGRQTEISAANYLQMLREEQENYIGQCFPTISSAGPNSSIMYYLPTPETDRKITTEELHMCDSGAHYKDGTTDVTRTVHFGTPSKHEQESFTRVLKGLIAITTCVFPENTKGSTLDILGRKALWDVGLDYNHGTGHGIGMYLNVTEASSGISWCKDEDPVLVEGMFLTEEPGYYEEGKFGVRLENVMRIVKAETPQKSSKDRFLTFKTISFIPLQRKLIEHSMMTKKETRIIKRK